jgi:hypothetical protein
MAKENKDEFPVSHEEALQKFNSSLDDLEKSNGNILILDGGRQMSSLSDEEESELLGLTEAEQRIRRRELLEDKILPGE